MTTAATRLSEHEWILLETVWEVFRSHGDWPVYQYVIDSMREFDVDTDALVMGLKPRFINHRRGGMAPWRDDKIALRIRGLAVLDDTEATVLANDAARTLGMLGRAFMTHKSHPLRVTEGIVLAADIAEELNLRGDRLARVYAVLDWDSHAYAVRGEPPEWSYQLGESVKRFHKIDSIEGYMLATDVDDQPTVPPVWEAPEPTSEPAQPSAGNVVNVHVPGRARNITVNPNQQTGAGHQIDQSQTGDGGSRWTMPVTVAGVLATIVGVVIAYLQFRSS